MTLQAVGGVGVEVRRAFLEAFILLGGEEVERGGGATRRTLVGCAPGAVPAGIMARDTGILNIRVMVLRAGRETGILKK